MLEKYPHELEERELSKEAEKEWSEKELGSCSFKKLE